MEKRCIECGDIRPIGTRRCKKCHKKAKREYAKQRHAKGIRTRYNHVCQHCNKAFVTTRKSSKICIKCYKSVKIKTKIKYIFCGKNKRLHRQIAEDILKRKLQSNECVHHLDNDTLNNDLSNLIVITRRTHGKVHRYLELQRGILGVLSDSWYSLIKDITLIWLDTQKIKCIKLWEINAS